MAIDNTLMAGLGGATALAGAIYGTIKSGQYNNKARQLIQQQRDDNRKWYDVKMSSDYTQRSDVQAAVKKQRDMLNETINRARATNAVAGGTDEALAMQKASANRSLAQTMTDIAASSAAYKDNIEQQYRQQDAALNQQQAQSYQQQAAQTAQAASQVVNAGLGIVGNSLASVTPQAPATPAAEGGLAVDATAYNNNAAKNRMAQIVQQNSDAQLAAALAQNKKLRNQ